jgi:hypothetical protein
MKKEAIMKDCRQKVLQAAERAKSWDIHRQRRALDAEAERIAGIRS